jgi:hypothetical protein
MCTRVIIRRQSTLATTADRWESLERHLDFILYDVLPGEKLFTFPRYAAHDRKTCESFVKACAPNICISLFIKHALESKKFKQAAL